MSHHPCFVGFNKAISRFIIQKPQGLNKCLKQLSLLGAIGARFEDNCFKTCGHIIIYLNNNFVKLILCNPIAR